MSLYNDDPIELDGPTLPYGGYDADDSSDTCGPCKACAGPRFRKLRSICRNVFECKCCKGCSGRDGGGGGGGGGGVGGWQKRIFPSILAMILFSTIFAFMTTSYLGGNSQIAAWTNAECYVVNVTWYNNIYVAGHDTFWLEDMWREYLETVAANNSGNDAAEGEGEDEDITDVVQAYAFETWYKAYNETSGFSDDPVLHLNDSSWRHAKYEIAAPGWVYSVVVLHRGTAMFTSVIKNPSRIKTLAPMHGIGENAPCIFRYVVLTYEDVVFADINPKFEIPEPSSPSSSPSRSPYAKTDANRLLDETYVSSPSSTTTVMVEEVFWLDVNGNGMAWENTAYSMRLSLMVMSFFMLVAFVCFLKTFFDYYDNISSSSAKPGAVIDVGLPVYGGSEEGRDKDHHY